MSRLIEIVEEVRRERAPDPRMSIFDVEVEAGAGAVRLVGETTDAQAVEELIARLAPKAGAAEIVDDVRRLGDGAGDTVHGLVRSAVAPVYAVPDVAAPMVTQLVLGHRVELLSRNGVWWRARAEDGYIGWVHHGYVMSTDRDWAHAWESGSDGDPFVSLGAELVDEEERPLMRIPWGARLLEESHGRFVLPDGTRGTIGSGEVVAVDRMRDRFPPRGESVTRTARRWIGSPYLWGGVTLAGTDCSGLVQSVYWTHGIALPRDSDMQSRAGAPVEVDGDWDAPRPGDLLFFAEKPGNISHVGLALGGGTLIHSSLGNGGVKINDLAGDEPIEEGLRRIFVCARRLLPD